MNSAEISNGSMATGFEHGGSLLTSPERLAPALSYPCLVAATTSNTSTTVSNSALLSSSPNLAASTSTAGTGHQPTGSATTTTSTTTEAVTPTSGAPLSSSSVPAPASSSSPLNSSCNGSTTDEGQLLASGTPPSPILGTGGGQQRQSRSRSPTSASPGRRETDAAAAHLATGSNDSSSREASLEKTSGTVGGGGGGTAALSAGMGGEGSLDQMSVEGGESGGSMRSFEHLPRNTTSGPDSINGSKVLAHFSYRTSILHRFCLVFDGGLHQQFKRTVCHVCNVVVSIAEWRQEEIGLVPNVESDVPFALRRLQTHFQRSAGRRAFDCRLFVRSAT